MKTSWYLVKVLPGKERQMADEFNRQISLGKMKNVNRFICPTEKHQVTVRNKKMIREKVLYSGYLYFESHIPLNDDELKTISLTQNIMGMGGNRIPIELRESDISRILKDDILDKHVDAKLTKYRVGETIIVNDGPFATFEGIISELKDEDKVDIEIKIFGRTNTISLTMNQIQKI